MCTVIILRRPGHDWPLILAANRDEQTDRPSLGPGRYWQKDPGVTAGQDLNAGGTWLGFHDQGLIVAMLNRQGSLGPMPGKRSRGLPAMDLLQRKKLAKARDYLRGLDLMFYRPFNAVLANRESAWWVRWDGNLLAENAISQGISLLGEGDLNDPSIARFCAYRMKFEAIDPPDPDRGEYGRWQSLLLQKAGPGENPRLGLFLGGDKGFGTVSSALMALSATGKLQWLHREKRDWQRVDLTNSLPPSG